MQTQLTRVDIETADGVADAILARPPGSGGAKFPGVLVYMDAFGLRPQLEDMAARLASAGYVVLVPNVFYRRGRAPVVELGDLKDPDARHGVFGKLRPIMQALTPARAMSDADAYLAYLTARDEIRDGAVGVVGYCMGGALALRTAAHAPDRVAAVASFHGGRLASDRPDSPHLQLHRITAEIYVGHADNDASMDPAQQRRLADALDAADATCQTELYDGAAHGFTMADTAVYDAAAAERHWERLLDLFSRTLST